ncbi:MAG: hypothetical protein HKN13_00790 [Rhodothermales bacterium]|nr:hypothetical protein [Rhodothermales bacterium]
MLDKIIHYCSTALVFCVIFTAVGCASQAPPDLTVENLKYQQLPSGARIVSGELLNKSSQAVPNAQLQLSLFDDNNILVSSMIIVVRDIPAGDRTEFREPVNAEGDVKAARVKSVLVL